MSTKAHRTLQHGLRSGAAFTRRRCQILRARERRQTPAPRAQALGWAVQTVRNALRVFHAEGFARLGPKSTRPKTAQPRLAATGQGRRRDRLHRRPRDFGKPTRIGTRARAAEVASPPGLTPRRLSTEAICRALRRRGVRGRRAKPGITSPDPQSTLKKK